MKVKYTIPKVYKSAKGWYVWFRYGGQLKKYRKDINRIKNLKERNMEANALASALLQLLREGWNPNTKSVDNSEKMYLLKAVEFAMEKKKETLAKKSFLDYNCTANLCKSAIKNLGYETLICNEVKRFHLLSILENMKKQRNWSAKAYNKNLGYLSAIFAELVQWNILEYNPANSLRRMKEIENIANVPPSSEEQQKIKKFLQENHPDFFNFVQVIYHTGIRPVEITRLKIQNIDLQKHTIIIPAIETKTGKDRIVPINQFLFQIFDKMNLEIFPDNYYVFGTKLRTRGSGKNFIPAPFKLKRDTATKLWKKLIKDELGINKNLYSEKHKGADDKILAGIELDALRELYGHSSKQMTERYARQVKEVYRKEIMDKSPDF